MLRKKSRPVIHLFTAVIFFVFTGLLVPGYTQKIIPDLYTQLKYRHIGPQGNRVIAVVGVPEDPNICYTGAASGGMWKSIDGGINWEKVLFVDEKTGCSDVVMDPNNPRILFVGTWQVDIKTWGRFSGGPGSGLYMSRDGGTTWKRLSGHGLPSTQVGKIAVAVAPSNSNRIYALIETGDGVPQKGKEVGNSVLWRSDDGGENWKLINYEHILNERPHYYSRLAVAPDDYNEVYFVAGILSISIDGGLTSKRVAVWPDKHDIWIDPTDPNRMMLACDGGPVITVNRGKTWNMVNLPVAQMYHVAVDNQIPYNVYGNRQDGPSVRGPSNSLSTGSGLWGVGITSGMWQQVGGCECGFAIPDPVDNNIVWSGCFAARFDRFDLRTGHTRSVMVWPESYIGWPAGEVKYRIQWTFPIAISPHDHNKVYTGSQYVHRTTDGGHSWTVISPDLSTNDKSKQQDSGGLKFDNLGVEYCCCIFAIAESPLEEGKRD